jgi:hypothetical protein
MSLAISYWLRRRDRGKAESAADAHSNTDAYFPQASLGSLSQINLICASWLMAAERSQSTHSEASLCQGVRVIFFEARELRFSGCSAGAGRSVGSGPGVAAPKSRCPG